MEREKLQLKIEQLQTDLKYVFISEENRLVSLHRICMIQQELIEALCEKVYPAPPPPARAPYCVKHISSCACPDCLLISESELDKALRQTFDEHYKNNR